MAKKIFTEKHTIPCKCGKGKIVKKVEVDRKIGQITFFESIKCKNYGPGFQAVYKPIPGFKRKPDNRPLEVRMYAAYKSLKRIFPHSNHKELIANLACDSGWTKKQVDKMVQAGKKQSKR